MKTQPLDLQTIFNTVVLHLFRQGQRSLGPTNWPAYYGRAGRRCAAGILIPAERYDPKMEGKSYDWVANSYKILPAAIRTPAAVRFISSLQDVHDTAANWHSTDRLRTACRLVAEAYDLDAGFLAHLELPA